MQISAGVERFQAKERELGSSIHSEDVPDEVAGVHPHVTYKGEMDADDWSCGMVAGLNHDVPTVAEPLDRTMAQAAEIIQVRAASTLTVPATHSPRAMTA